MPEIWCDASWGGKEVDPFGGGFIRWRGAAVAWISRKLKFIPLSTCEAEVAAMCIMLKEGLFVKGILEDLKVDVAGKKMAMITDSKSGMDVVKNPGVTKHSVHTAL